MIITIFTKRFKYWAGLTFVLLGLLGGCNKDELLVSDLPEIAFVSMTPTTVTEYQDSVEIKIWYRDGNGDLGENDPNVDNLFIIDPGMFKSLRYCHLQVLPEHAA